MKSEAASPPHAERPAQAVEASTAGDASWMAKLGPGFVTGAADDDPSGIATYSQAGTKFGFDLLWTVVLTYPLMLGIQLVCARIGRVTGHGLATNIRRHYPPLFLYAAVSLLLVANTVNIAADIAAMADVVKLLAGGNSLVYVIVFGAVSALLQVFIPYSRYVRILKWLTLALLAYVATVLVVHVPWREVAVRTFVPHLSWDGEAVTMVVAIFGTTLSPYLFFWQASQEVEEQRAIPKARPLKRASKRTAVRVLLRMRDDTAIGMAFSNLVAFFIILTTAATLHATGVGEIETSAQAANALRPVAGEFAYMLFSLGIIGTGLLAVPVLAGSAAYAMAGAFRWRNSLELQPSAAKQFYGIIVASTLGGVALNFVPLDPIKALFWSAVVNGVIAVPIMVIIMLLATRRDVMGNYAAVGKLKALGWASTLAMAAVVVAMFWTMAAA